MSTASNHNTAPRSALYDAVVVDAKDRCALRVLEAARMRGLLALLQPCMDAIKAAGLDVRPSDLFEASAQGRRGICIAVGGVENTRRLYEVLVSEGLRELGRGNVNGPCCLVWLGRGELLVELCFVGCEATLPTERGAACS